MILLDKDSNKLFKITIGNKLDRTDRCDSCYLTNNRHCMSSITGRYLVSAKTGSRFRCGIFLTGADRFDDGIPIMNEIKGMKERLG